MELVEGETLAERIASGPIPVDEAIPLFVQIAEGVEAAHEKGIIHRDLKPANIKIGPDGKPKILDFGLAKAFAGDGEASPDSSQSPTLTKGTALGTIMGTASYMSPEQARGKTVDKRTDIWAFGAVLYEALTAKKAFDGETVTDIFASIVKGTPAWAALPPATPPSIRRLLKRCLQKDTRNRLRDVADARIELVAASKEEGAEPEASPRRPAGLLIVAALAIALLGLVVGSQLRSPLLRKTARVAVNLGPGEELVVGRRPALAISPDGTRLVYALDGTDFDFKNTPLFLRHLDRYDAELISGTERGRVPFFSPDGGSASSLTASSPKCP